MTLQEAKICMKMQYPVFLTGNVDTFGYWEPSPDKLFNVSGVNEHYNAELKQWRNTITVKEVRWDHSYEVKEVNVAIAPGFEKTLEEDIRKLKDERLEKIILAMLQEGMKEKDILDGINDILGKADGGLKATVKEVIDYLNGKLGTRYRATSKKTQKHINARLREGYGIEDFKTVIDNKVADWKENEKMAQQLNPDVLFGTNFEKYLNAQRAVPKGRLRCKPSFDIEEIQREADLNDDFGI